jgi:hypothetical protein
MSPTREPPLELMLRQLGQRLAEEGRTLDRVLFAGDAQNQGKPGGHELVLRLLLDHLGSVGVTADRIVAVPGNHDVLRDSAPAAPIATRISLTCGAPRAASCCGWTAPIPAGSRPIGIA